MNGIYFIDDKNRSIDFCIDEQTNISINIFIFINLQNL